MDKDHNPKVLSCTMLTRISDGINYTGMNFIN